jgi:hypothetical protein
MVFGTVKESPLSEVPSLVSESDQPEYIGVKTGLLGTRSTLILFQMATVQDSRQAIVVATDKDTAKNGPSFDDACEITPEFENEVYSYYGLQQTADTGSYRSYRSYDPPEATETTGVAGRTDVSGEEARAGQEEENPTKQPDHVTVTDAAVSISAGRYPLRAPALGEAHMPWDS